MSIFISLLGPAKENFLKQNGEEIPAPTPTTLKNFFQTKKVPVCFIKSLNNIALVVNSEEELQRAIEKTFNKKSVWYLVNVDKLNPPITNKPVNI